MCNNISRGGHLQKEREDKLQYDLDQALIELKRTKIELALAEERKQESEQSYKNEIKYLIDKLLKAKNKLKRERQGREDDELRHNVSMSFISTNGSFL